MLCFHPEHSVRVGLSDILHFVQVTFESLKIHHLNHPSIFIPVVGDHFSSSFHLSSCVSLVNHLCSLNQSPHYETKGSDSLCGLLWLLYYIATYITTTLNPMELYGEIINITFGCNQ